jgi:hypothetical protein
MSRASEAYKKLTFAMAATDPACKNDERFMDDDTSAEAVAFTCRSCPLFDLCATYAEIERPKAGIWAGKRYRTNQPRKVGGAG